MASIFNKTNNLYENPKRNTFDLSFQNNLTLNFGELVPCFVKECLPGDSFKIDPTMSINMLPMLFPVQTRIRAHVHFFYVTNRSLWKDWQDFIGNTRENLELPYLYYNKRNYTTGSIYDYMGLPTTSIGQTYLIAKNSSKLPAYTFGSVETSGDARIAPVIVDTNNTSINIPVFVPQMGDSGLGFSVRTNTTTPTTEDINNFNLLYTYLYLGIDVSQLNHTDSGRSERIASANINTNFERPSSFVTDSIGNITTGSRNNGTLRITQTYEKKFHVLNSTTSASSYIVIPNVDTRKSIWNEDELFQPLLMGKNSSLPETSRCFLRLLKYDSTGSIADEIYAYVPVVARNTSEYDFSLYTDTTLYGIDLSTEITIGVARNELAILMQEGYTIDRCLIRFDTSYTNGVSTESNITLLGYKGNSTISNDFITDFKQKIYNPYYRPLDYSEDLTDNNLYEQIKVNALPFRAYEAIYNSFYRDERNNPFITDEGPTYNKFIISNNGGEDDILQYKLHKRNWEADFLTTAVQSPQQGVAPLVGITSYGEITFKDTDTGEIYTAQLNTSDGDTIESFEVTSPNMPKENLRQLVDYATSGISISDLRGVNSLQRWLEINMRRGLRYKDQIMSHFGVDVRYDELLMPEFIGGFSEDVYVNRVNQTVETSDNPLGWQAGQGGAFGSSKHSINHFCQEHGYIIGIISISPVANYSQLLPKHFLKRNLLDYYFPEFGHLGMQPITYEEVCPIEAINNNRPLTDVFGYQRAWYDYLASTDEVHGLFRTSLRNFVIGRKFAGVPELSPDFLTINHNEIDDVFAVTSSDDSHKFLGQIYFDCKVKRCIPEYGVPKLEV